MTSIAHRFGGAVRQTRESRGWSQEVLAGRAELNRSYLGEVERGAAMPSLATAAKIAAALEQSLASLIMRSESGLESKPVDAVS